MITKDAPKQRTTSLLFLPHTLRLYDLAVIWKMSAFLCLLSAFVFFLNVPGIKPKQPSSLSREGDSWCCLSEGRTSQWLAECTHSTATNSPAEGCPVNQTSWQLCCRCWEGDSRTQLTDSAAESSGFMMGPLVLSLFKLYSHALFKWFEHFFPHRFRPKWSTDQHSHSFHFCQICPLVETVVFMYLALVLPECMTEVHSSVAWWC